MCVSDWHILLTRHRDLAGNSSASPVAPVSGSPGGGALEGLLQGQDRCVGTQTGIGLPFLVKEGSAGWSPASFKGVSGIFTTLLVTMKIHERSGSGEKGFRSSQSRRLGCRSSACAGGSLQSRFLQLPGKQRAQAGRGVGCKSPGRHQPLPSPYWALSSISPLSSEILVFQSGLRVSF